MEFESKSFLAISLMRRNNADEASFSSADVLPVFSLRVQILN